MPKLRKATSKLYHEVPNPQLFEAAKQFHQGFWVLIRQGSDTGALLPALQCAAVALELYLKCLSASEAPILRIHVEGESHSHAHSLEVLFELIPPDARHLLDKAVQLAPRLKAFPDALAALRAHSAMLSDLRHPFEQGTSFNQVEIGVLSELLVAVRSAVALVEHRFIKRAAAVH